MEQLKKVKLEKVEEMNKKKCSLCKGQEVGLVSPNNFDMVALATVQNSEPNSIELDGKPLSECVEVMINIVQKRSTKLPRPQGRIIRMENAMAKCIPWLRTCVSTS